MRSYNNKGTGLNVFFTAILMLVAAVVVGGAGAWIIDDAQDRDASVVAQDTSHDTSSDTGNDVEVPVVDLPVESLEGQWIAESNGSKFVAQVAGGNISLELVSDKTSMLYWNGTFDTAQSPEATILSKKVEGDRAVLSSATEKTFTYANNTLSFEFEARSLGLKTVVEMRRA